MSSGWRCNAFMNASGFSRRDSEARQPRGIRASQDLSGLVPMSLVGVDAPDDDVVLEHHRRGEVGGGVADGPAARADAGEADDAAGAHNVDRVGDDLADARALDDHVGLESHVGGATGVIRRPQGANQIGLGARFDAIEDVDLEPVLLANQRRQQADRSGAGDEHRVRLPERALADRVDLLPGLRDDGRGFQQHAEQAERRVDLHRVLGLDPPALRHEAVDFLDAALGVLAVAAHVPFTDRAVRARHRVGAPDDADDQVALAERAGRTRVDDAAERLVAEHKPRLARRCPAVLAFDDLDVGPAHADGDRLDEHGPVARVGLRDVIEAGAPGCVRLDGDGLQVDPFRYSSRNRLRPEAQQSIGRRGEPLIRENRESGKFSSGMQ